ncbi:hypothetical protein SE19_06820 [Acidiplasma aeolicum]|uniref:Uncharacterized protein n=1 Tax=Acidiplasma aeolicum TaxID=507754 RepID=A0A0P9ER47_9ARCH|nr:hypothetical protein TZ01_00180 [Acidiplasma sp. MBA-1]KPV46158.1 hypothetical protein SE19_06820 [Acidiplasma aeolicum]KQB36303.1 hypothetical protein AOG54_07635 [Acidiplasma aeolicum]
MVYASGSKVGEIIKGDEEDNEGNGHDGQDYGYVKERLIKSYKLLICQTSLVYRQKDDDSK